MAPAAGSGGVDAGRNSAWADAGDASGKIHAFHTSRSWRAEHEPRSIRPGSPDGGKIVMPPLAQRNLFHDKVRLTVTLTGIVFSVVLIVVQLGLFFGFTTATSNLIDHSGADRSEERSVGKECRSRW